MLYISYLISSIEVLIVTIPVLLIVAFITIAERKTMASMQRRLGPNLVGYYGLLQAFADALKLLLKEYVSPTQANLVLFFLGPIITLIFSLLGYVVIPYAPGVSLFDFNLGVLYMLAVSSLATYGILLAGWSANSKYAFLGSLRSTAQLISYELVLTSAILLVILLTSSLNLSVNIEVQKIIWFIIPLFPIFMLFFIAAIAETNRAPFDLAEAESELVSGFMTEHSAVIFVFFFLAEYSSILLICLMVSIFFLGGYNMYFEVYLYIIDVIYNILIYMQILYNHLVLNFFNFEQNILRLLESTIHGDLIINLYNRINYYDINIYKISENDIKYIINKILSVQFVFDISFNDFKTENIINDFRADNILYSLVIAIKTFVMIFIFIWVRASFPRIRFDQLMSYCWTVLLPLLFAFILLIPCLLHAFNKMPSNIIFF